VTAYTYYCNVRRLCKLALGFKLPKAKEQKSGVDRIIASVNKLADVAQIQRVIDALNARKVALAKAA